MKSPYGNMLLDNSISFDYPPDIYPTPIVKNYAIPQTKSTTPKSISQVEKFIDERYDKIKDTKHSSNLLPMAASSVEKKSNKINVDALLTSSLENQIECLKSEIFFLREEMREKNHVIKTLLNRTINLDWKPSEFEKTNDNNCLMSKNKMNEILDELNRTNKNLNDLANAIVIKPSTQVATISPSYNDNSYENTKSPSEKTDIDGIRKNNIYNDKNPFSDNHHSHPSNPFYSHVLINKSNITYRNHKELDLKKIKKDCISSIDKDVDFDIKISDVVNSKTGDINNITNSTENPTDDTNVTDNININGNPNYKNEKDDKISDISTSGNDISDTNKCSSKDKNIKNVIGTKSDEIDSSNDKSNSDTNTNFNTGCKKGIEQKKEENNNNQGRKEDNNNNQGRKAIYIVGDSMIKELKGYELAKSIGHKRAVKVRSHPSAQIRCLADHIQPIIRNNDTEHVLLHIGTNDLKTEKTPVQICHDIMHLTSLIRDKGIKVSISGIIQRNDSLNNKVLLVNDSLKKICESVGVTYINNGNIRPDLHLNASRIHLNRRGNNIYISNIRKFLNKLI